MSHTHKTALQKDYDRCPWEPRQPMASAGERGRLLRRATTPQDAPTRGAGWAEPILRTGFHGWM